MNDEEKKIETIKKNIEKLQETSKEIGKHMEKKDEQKTELPKQHHPFIPVTETTRTYIFPKGEKIRVDHVYGISIRPDGGHRLLSRVNPKQAWSIAPGWLTIIHEVNSDEVTGYVFTD